MATTETTRHSKPFSIRSIADLITYNSYTKRHFKVSSKVQLKCYRKRDYYPSLTRERNEYWLITFIRAYVRF